MEKSRIVLSAKFATVLSVVPILLFAYKEGPDPRKTGAPGDRTCAESGCHVGSPVGDRVSFEFSDGNTYTPGQKKRVTVVISDSATRYGFQASSRLASNPSSAQAGTFTTPDNTMLVLCEDGRPRPAAGCSESAQLEFIEHNVPRAEARFEFEWTPPDSNVGDIMFYAAGNAANGNDQNTGDRIHTTSATLTFAGGSVGTRPAISSGGVVNAGSFLANIASGTWISIFGQNLAADTRGLVGSDIVDNTLPTRLGDVSVEINGRPGYLSFISPGQINVLVPEDPNTGDVGVTVVSGSNRSSVATVVKQNISPAFLPFTDSAGRRYIAARHADFSVLGKQDLFQGLATTPARPEEVILLFGVGFGPTDPTVPIGTVPANIARTTSEVQVFFGDMPAQVSYAGVSPGSAGLYQLNVTVPAGVPNGDVPVRAEIGGLRTQENIFITVQR